MHRQALIVATAGLAALVLTGCSTLDDATVAGRVEEATISFDDVVEVLADTPDGAHARNIIESHLANLLNSARKTHTM